MVSATPQQIHVALEQWLNRVGFSKGNPFGISEAESEPFVSECFVDPSIYDALKDDPRALLVFAPRGGGKTALRVMLSSDCRPLQPTDVYPRSPDLAVTYSDFDPALIACDYDLERLRPAHHVAGILRSACSAALDALWQDTDLINSLSARLRTRFAAYCRHFNPDLLSADATEQRLKSTCSEAEVPWRALRLAVSEGRLAASLPEWGVPPSPQLDFFAGLVDDTPEPLANLDSALDLLARFVQILEGMGLDKVYILLDRLDERLITFHDPDKLAALVAPLITNLELIGVPNVAFRLFLPREAQEAMLPFVRDDRCLDVLDVTWGVEPLRELLRLRLQVYSEDKIQTLGKLCKPGLAAKIENEMIELADGSPRRLLQLGATLFETHVALSPNQRAISEEAWAVTPTKILGDGYVRPLRLDREAGQVYLGRTTPVQLAPLPYRLVVALYEARGFCTNREIAEAVWESWASDEQIRQTIRRVRDALKETGANPELYLVNEPGRGYKLQNTA